MPLLRLLGRAADDPEDASSVLSSYPHATDALQLTGRRNAAPYSHTDACQHTPRGTALVDATETTDLVLANDTDYRTGAALHSGQRNTTPDLTLSTPDYVKDWRCDPDAWGSNHYLLWKTLNMGRKSAAGRTVRTVRWDAYRRAFAVQPKTASVRERASHALRMATTETEVRADAPTPDIHMLNLWDARKRAQLMYVENGRRHRDSATLTSHCRR
ncbi:hypothetical protein HPB49_000169 [Dermacentor silvarum]|uniref:Uncharacterized protein n=1 Tax=Dermacentor silvarum TaxID=543639 RepID=A0ACB8D130_DERSI|nr:hypothetical protein HPB49_000169 [Dermacentor silvarum]